MSIYIERANLPEDTEKLIIGRKYADILDKSLKKMGLMPIYVPDNPDVDCRLSGHADLSVFHPGGRDIFLAPYLKGSEYAYNMQENGFKCIYSDINQSDKYPFDAQLNLCAVGKTLIYSDISAYKPAVNYFTNDVSRLIAVKQGYSRCLVSVVDDNSIITADRGVYKACTNAGMDVLLISPGYIRLEGYDYGFIGGASFKASARTLVFTGSLDMHPDRLRIIDFIKSKGIEPVFLTEYPIFDIGSAIPITEKARA